MSRFCLRHAPDISPEGSKAAVLTSSLVRYYINSVYSNTKFLHQIFTCSEAMSSRYVMSEITHWKPIGYKKTLFLNDRACKKLVWGYSVRYPVGCGMLLRLDTQLIVGSLRVTWQPRGCSYSFYHTDAKQKNHNQKENGTKKSNQKGYQKGSYKSGYD